MKQAPVNIKNKRATFDYELVDTYTAGIVLTGTEIKSIRMGKASLVDTFCYFANGELWVKNMHISEYFYGSYNNHSARRERKLLLTKKELDKLARGAKDPGFTMIPIRMFINEKGLAKVVVALAKGKKQYDKREALKEKDDKRVRVSSTSPAASTCARSTNSPEPAPAAAKHPMPSSSPNSSATA